MQEGMQQNVFDAWIREHKGLMLKVVRAYAFTPDDQDDLFQEIALQLWNSVPIRRGEAAETTWIYRVALYSALAWSRKERKHRSGRQDIDEVQHTLRFVPATQDARLEWLYKEIGKFEEVDRSLVLLLLEGFGYREMAEILGISESNVGVKISRIKRRLATIAMEATP
jgi:RNA polymerase sigma-70 factor (ECF subfamily)